MAAAESAALRLDDARARSPTARVAATRLRGHWLDAATETVAEEVPVALFYNGVSHVVMMASPADLEDFAVGFSLAEGIVGRADEIADLACNDVTLGLTLAMRIPEERTRALRVRRRNLPGRTGCGLCGVTSIDQALRPLPPVPAAAPIPAGAIRAALDALPRLQPVNHATGAVHAAAFADRAGRLLAVREDIGRHNALDKLIGAVARTGLDPAQGFALVTSRCSMEMVQKAATFGFPLLAAISGPTALAVALSQDCGLGLAAFARGDGFNLYAHAGRVDMNA